MPLDPARIRQRLKDFDFKSLFIEELGWDRYKAQPLPIPIDGLMYSLQAQAEKRGMVIFLCQANGTRIPDYAIRRKIEQQVAKTAYEHIIIHADSAKAIQIWQWVRREKGRPAACREHIFRKEQSGDGLVQKLQTLAFTIEEEESTTLTRVTGRVRQAFDVDRVTKGFFERFKREHNAFLGFIKGIQVETDQKWYASLMLNRLMFVYFIQKKGFLDGDIHYLRHRLQVTQQRKGKDSFLSFYRYFLRRLFHEGLGHPSHSRELAGLLGKVPYLNGGLFEVHDLENVYPSIDIPDGAFEKIFDFFDAYHWHLDDRPLRADNEINPDVLGYIFEKYINQKGTGAYYTKEDITEYISKNTIIPFLFEAAEKKCSVAFKPENSVWRMLRNDPDRYIYEAVRKGVDLRLPEEVASGLNDVTKRACWNGPAGPEFALPTETWRQHINRRQRCLELRQKLTAGEVHNVNDLITYNLDIRTFAEDVIWTCEGPELLRAIYFTIAGRIPEKPNEKFERGMSILDPTCGSGAFLFAALNILEPLYQACLARMESFVEDHDRAHPGELTKFLDFRKILERVDQHSNQRYFVLKSVILGNLYGVDIMEEAVEICKLRLFLKLVAEVEPAASEPNLGLEPLPDIDFNIRAGNTLVGFVNEESLRQHFSESGHGQQRILSAEETALIARIDETAEIAGGAYQRFREMQTKHEMAPDQFVAAKEEVRRRLKELGAELDRYLAADYGIAPPGFKNTKEFDTAFVGWRTSHQPFHWFVEFYGIMKSGGFDVILGNPPWIEYARVKQDYTIREYRTECCGNLHAACTERGLQIRTSAGYMSFIVQLPMVSSSRMLQVRQSLKESSSLLHVITFGDRPGKLFDGLEHSRATIWISSGGVRNSCLHHQLATTRYHRWPTEVRSHLFDLIEYARVDRVVLHQDQFPKYANRLQTQVFEKISQRGSHTIGHFAAQRPTRHFVFYQEATEYWIKSTVGLPYYSKDGTVAAPAHGRHIHFSQSDSARFVCAVMHSSLFYSYFIAYGDCFHLSDKLVRNFPIPLVLTEDPELVRLGDELMGTLQSGAERKTIRTRDGHQIAYEEYYGWKAKNTIDRIDSALARHYGFTDEELDFIINYDIKYRMGGGTADAEDG